MKRFLSILLSLMMVLSSVSYALPSAVETFDSAVETQLPLDELFDEEENLSESATLAATDTTEYGELIVKFDMESITVGTNYTDVLHGTAGTSVNGLSVFGGEIGTGSNKDVGAGDPFLFDGNRNNVGRHTSVVGAQDASGNKYLRLTGAGTDGYFGMRDYNGSGFAKTGHYILTFDVLNADVNEFTGAFFHNSAESIKYTVPVVRSDANGDWTTLAVSLDDNASIGTCNYMFVTTSIASGATAAIDNITLWWVPAEVTFNVTHDVEGILDDGTFTAAGGIKTIEELKSIIDPDDRFLNAGYYLAGFRDENGVISDSAVLNESGKSYTAVWDKLNILLGYTFDGTENLANVSPTGATGAVSNGEYITTVSADQGSYRVNISNISFSVSELGDIIYRMKNTGTGAFNTVYFVYVENSTTKTYNWSYTVPSEYVTINTTDMWGLPSVWMSGINTLTHFRVQGSAKSGAVVHYDFIYVLGKDKDAGDNVLIKPDAPDCELNDFKVVFDSTTTAQNILDLIDTDGYNGIYVPDSLVAPDGTVLTGSDLIAGYVDDQDVLAVNWEKSEYIGDYGELVFEVNFEKLAAGAAGTAFSYDMQSSGDANGNFLSNFGGKVNPAYSVSESEIYVRNETGKANIVIKEDAEHGKYVEYTITSDGTSKNVWDFTPYTSGKKFADKDGYFILTADYKQPKDGHVIQTHWNRSHNAEDMVKVAAKETYPAANTWGEYRSIYDADSIGKSEHKPPIASVTEINHVLLYNSSQAAGETYAFDNVRLWWVPKTVNITVPAGSNTSVSDQVFTIVPTETTAGDLANMVYGGTKGVAGFSLTEGGEVLATNKLLAFAYDTTLYPVWEDVNILESSLEFNSSSDISKISFRTGSNNSLGSGFASIVDNSYMRVTFTGTNTTRVVQDTGFNYTLPTAIAAGELDRIEMRVRFTGMPADDVSLTQADGSTAHYDPDNVSWPEMYYNNAAIHDADNAISLSGKDGEWFKVSYSAQEAGLASTELSQFRYDFFNYMPSGTTLDIDYIRFIGAPLNQLTVDMGDNTTATPVSMSYGPATTVANVIAKIIDHGDKKFLGLSRTPGGAVLASTEKAGDGSGDVTLYAVWEDYEYLDKYNVEFNDEDTHKFHVEQNNAQTSYELKDGVLTLKAVPKDGYTATWDHQIYVDTVNAATAIPSGVVDYIAVRMRYRNVPSASASYTVESRGTNTFNPADNPAYVHIARYGTTAWGSNLQSNDRREKNIVDGQWFVRLLDANTYFKDGLAYVRFDSPYPMPAGMEMDIDYIRFIGDETKLPEVEYESQYGEMVWSLNFDKATTGVQTISYKPIWELGADLNLDFNAAYDYAELKMTNGGSPTTEIVASANGSGNYLKVTATKDGTGNFLYVHGSKNFSDKDGYYIITYDVINETSASVPHTFRLNYLDRVEDPVDNIQIIENGEWDKAVVYYDKQIGTGTNSTGYVISDITDITNVKFHNTSTAKTGETICIDNLTLWYVPKTVDIIVDNSAVGAEATIIEDYPTCGMTNEELSTLLPAVDNAKFGGLSKKENGSVLYENRTTTSDVLYSVWAVDTVLTVDNGDNTKATPVTMSMPAGSSVKVSDIKAKFIDSGDKIFKGVALTENGDALADNYTINSNEVGAVTLYALWDEYYTNDFYSAEFDHKNQDVVMDSTSLLSPGKNSVYRQDAKDAYGNDAPGNINDALVWNEEEGYLTFNFTASEYAKAQASAYSSGMKAAVYDAFFQLSSLYDAEGETHFIPAGNVDKIAIRMRYRNMPETAETLWYYRKEKVNNTDVEKYTIDYNPESVKPYFHFTSDSIAAFGGSTVDIHFTDVSEGSAYRDNWFTVFIDVNTTNFKMNTDALKSIRLDFADTMPDGAAVDIDFIRFITDKEVYNYDAPTSRKDLVSARIKADDADRNGIRVLAQVVSPTKLESADIGWMFTSSDRWNKSNGSTERSWYELKMDLYDGSSFIKVGFTKLDGEDQVRFREQTDAYAAFTAVLYNIPVKNYKSPFIVRPFAKLNGSYAYGEPFEINFLDVLERVVTAYPDDADAVAYYNECNAAYAAHLEENAAYDADETNAQLAAIMSSRSSILSNLIIPTNDVAPTIAGNIVSMRVWKNNAFETIQVSTKNAYPALLTDEGLLSDAYAEKPCVYYLSNGVYYIKSLGRATTPNGDYVGVNKSDTSAMEANVDASALFLSEIEEGEMASPFQRLPIDDELTNGQNSFFLGDFATGKFDFTFSRANSATKTIETGKTGIIGSDSKVVAKYNFADSTTEWVSFAQAQLLKMGLDSDNYDIKDGIDFTNLTYVVSNNTTTAGENQREYEDLAVLAGEVDVPAHTTTLTNFNSAEYNKVIVKTTSNADYVTVTFTRADGVSNSIKYYAYGTTPDGYRIFDVDLDGIAKYHSTISSLTVKANGSNTSYIQYAYLVKNPNYYTTADLASMTRTEIFADTSFDNGFYVRDMDQKMKKDEWQNYTFANNGNTPVWMIDPWYSYDYSDSANKASYELYNIASPTATSLADSQGTKVVKFNGTKTSTQADGKSYTGDVLSLTLNGRAIYDGKKHSEMQSAGMIYWPHLLIEQNREVNTVDVERNSAGADKIFLEMDIKMTNYEAKVDSMLSSAGAKQLQFLLYTYLRPKANDGDRIWFGASLCSEGTVDYPTWNRDTGASSYIYCIPQEVVYQGISNSFYQHIEDNTDDESFFGGGTTKTSKDWVHVSLDVTPYIQTAIDWANREDAFGLGTLKRDDFYFDGVNIGFETHGNIDGTFEIANFNFVAYND